MFKLFSYLKSYPKMVVLAPLLMLLEVAMDLLQPRLIAIVVDQGIATGDLSLIMRIGLTMIGVAIIGMMAGVGCTIASSIASEGFAADLRTDLYRKVQSFSFANLDRFKTASLITRLTNDVLQVKNIVYMALRIVIRAPFMCIGGIIMAVLINARLTLSLVVAIPLLVLALSIAIARGFPLFAIVQQKLDRVNEVIRENLSGVRVVKAFVRADFEKTRFAQANQELIEITVKASRMVALVLPIILLILNLSIVAVLWFGGIQINQGNMQVGQLIAFINYLTQILTSLLMVAFILMAVSRAKASADRINEVLASEVEIKDRSGADSSPITEGKLRFENVSFRYQGAKGEPVLKNISFEAKPGETVAIIGATGAGKSTLINLIPRLYEPTAGRILIDGKDIKDLKLNTLRKSISVVLQESLLFSGSIDDNLKLGHQDASPEEVSQAARVAQADYFITSFPEGYQTQLGQKGVNLSGGQKQRLAIARALLKKSKILILDDSTSAVDVGTEARIQRGLRELMKQCTTIVIAQRISTVHQADKILVLDDGKIVAQGSSTELLKSCKIYQDIYTSQLGKGVI